MDFNLEDELCRKVGDAYCWLDNEYKRGAIPAHALHTSLLALDLAVMGLIPEPFSTWATQTRIVLKAPFEIERRVFMKGEVTSVVTFHRGAATVDVARLAQGLKTDLHYGFADEIDEIRAAQARFESICAKLTSNGYTELA